MKRSVSSEGGGGGGGGGGMSGWMGRGSLAAGKCTTVRDGVGWW